VRWLVHSIFDCTAGEDAHSAQRIVGEAHIRQRPADALPPALRDRATFRRCATERHYSTKIAFIRARKNPARDARCASSPDDVVGFYSRGDLTIRGKFVGKDITTAFCLSPIRAARHM